MNILGIDYGTRRIGLAWCDTTVDVVLPFGVVDGPQTSDLRLRRLIDIIEKEHIDQIVVGLPIGLDGQENENTKKVHTFIRALKSATASRRGPAHCGKVRVPIATFDERFTSAEADRMEGDTTRDEKAAMLILQNYLDTQR